MSFVTVKKILRLIAVLSLFFHVDTFASSQGYALTSSIWDSKNIPVCWVNPATTNIEEQNWVRGIVEDTWEFNSSVTFTGWGVCPELNDYTSIRIMIQDSGPHVKALGKGIVNYDTGMVLNFTFNNWSSVCSQSIMRRDCIEDIAVHEFGHALGFAHEQNRSDTPRMCDAEPQGTNGDTFIGAWDLDSVMNYCNPDWNGDGNLSDTDIRMLRVYYGNENLIGVRAYAKDADKTQWWVDLNGDGLKDLVYKRNDSREYRVLLNTGTKLSNDISWGSRTYTISDSKNQWLQDMNKDGKVDLVYLREGTREYRVMLNSGSKFGADISWGTRSQALDSTEEQWWFDMNRDGVVDFIYKPEGTKSYRVLINTKAGFSSDQLWGTRAYTAGSASEQWFVDGDNDGLVDLIYKKDGTYSYYYKRNNGATFSNDTLFVQRTYIAGDAQEQWWRDLNNDGYVDLVYRRFDTREYRVMFNLGAGFSNDRSFGLRTHPNESPVTQWWKDLNSDGYLDLVYKREDRRDYHALLSNGSSLLADNPIGHRGFTIDNNSDQWIEDFNNDEKLEVLYEKDDTREYRLLHLTIE